MPAKSPTKFSENNIKKSAVLPIIFGFIGVAIVLVLSLYFIPNLYYKTENGLLEKSDTVVMKTNFGDMEIDLSLKTDKARANFISLSSQDLYDNNISHRIVEQDNFAVFQAGQMNIASDSFEDEIWEVAPEFIDGDSIRQKPEPVPVPLEPEYYDLSYNEEFEVWYTTYKKGLIIMANSGPDTNSTQFFVTLEDTFLQPNYTVFGSIDESDFHVLDKISQDVDPINEGGDIIEDGTPSQDIIIKDIEVKPYNIINKF